MALRSDKQGISVGFRRFLLFRKQIITQLNVFGNLQSAICPTVGDGIRPAGANPLDAGLRLLLVASIQKRATCQHRFGTVFDVKPERGTFQNLQSGQRHVAATNQFNQTLTLDRRHTRHRVLARLSVLNLQTGQRAVLTIDQPDTGTQFLVFVIGIVSKTVRADHQISTVFRKQISVVSAVDVVPLEGNSTSQRQMNVGGLTSNQVSTDAPHSRQMTMLRSTADNSNVRPVGAVGRLNGVAGDRSFANGPPLRTIDVDFGRRNIGQIRNVERAEVVVFDVVPGNLQIPNLAVVDADPAEAIVTDVTADDVCLMQIDVVEPDADPRVVIDVTMTDQHIAATLRDVDRIANSANQDTGQRRLHDSTKAHPVGLGVLPFNLNLAD